MFDLFPKCIGLRELQEYFEETSLKFPLFYSPEPLKQELTPSQRDIQLRHNSRVARGETYSDIAQELAEQLVEKDRKIKKLQLELKKLKANTSSNKKQ
jgi:hypothetical protein